MDLLLDMFLLLYFNIYFWTLNIAKFLFMCIFIYVFLFYVSNLVLRLCILEIIFIVWLSTCLVSNFSLAMYNLPIY